MNTKYVLYGLILIIIIVFASAIVYVNYFGNQSTQHTISITDDEGYTTTFDGIPQRIVSMAPANTQLIYAIDAGDRVVGVTKYDDYPYNFTAWFAAGNMTNIGGFSTPNIETIASLQPDLILATTIHDAEVTPTLRNLGYNVVVLNPTNISGIYHDIELLGTATGMQSKSTELVNQISSQINNITSIIANAHITDKPKVYYEVYYDPTDPATAIMSAGATSWINDVISKAGGVNIFGDQNKQFPTTGSEQIVTLNPNVILLPTNMGTGTPSYGSIDQVKARPAWNTIDAVQNNRIYIIEQDLFNEPGPRVGDQVQAVAHCLYPNLISAPAGN